MIEFLDFVLNHVSSVASCLKVCVECFLAFVKLKNHFNKTPKNGKPTSTKSRKRTGSNSTHPKKK